MVNQDDQREAIKRAYSAAPESASQHMAVLPDFQLKLPHQTLERLVREKAQLDQKIVEASRPASQGLIVDLVGR
jgi:hypothetical protein